MDLATPGAYKSKYTALIVVRVAFSKTLLPICFPVIDTKGQNLRNRLAADIGKTNDMSWAFVPWLFSVLREEFLYGSLAVVGHEKSISTVGVLLQKFAVIGDELLLQNTIELFLWEKLCSTIKG